MNYWRMAMRVGNQGPDMFPECRKRGIAAIDYDTEQGERIVEDCRHLSNEEYALAWKRKDPKNTTGRSSLAHVAYDMKKGDVIYAKSGPMISGKGVVTEEYAYDPAIMKGAGYDFAHFVRVQWEDDFPEFRCLLGAEPHTVLELDGDRLRKVQQEEALARPRTSAQEQTIPVEAAADEVTATEGHLRTLMIEHRIREHKLREAKLREAMRRQNGHLVCEVPGCGFDFMEVYGELGQGFAHVHHLKPLASLSGPVQMRTSDLAVVCANCHSMIHRNANCLPLEGLIKNCRGK